MTKLCGWPSRTYGIWETILQWRPLKIRQEKHLFSLSVVQNLLALRIFAALFKLVCYDYKMTTDPMLDPAEIMTQKLFDWEHCAFITVCSSMIILVRESWPLPRAKTCSFSSLSRRHIREWKKKKLKKV